jgi:hypothetical protein
MPRALCGTFFYDEDEVREAREALARRRRVDTGLGNAQDKSTDTSSFMDDIAGEIVGPLPNGENSGGLVPDRDRPKAH